MLFAAFLRWWYGPGWAGTIRHSKDYLIGLIRNFSILILLKTLFAPWKQLDAYGRTNQSLGDRFRHGIDKFVSRFVGFTVRSLTLWAAAISFIFLLIVRVVWILIWPGLPLLVPLAILYSLGVIG
jgi:hypothetical protein